MIFDTRTLVLIFGLVSLISALILYFFYRQQSVIPGPREWAIGAVFQALGALFLLTHELTSPLVSIMGNNLSFFLSYAFFYQGIRRFIGKPMEWKSTGMIIILLSTPLLFLYHSSEYLSERIVLNAFGTGLFCFMSGWVLFREANHRLPARTAVAIVFLAIGMLHAYRLYLNLFLPHPIDTHLLQESSREHLIFIGGILGIIVVTSGFVVMTSERLRNALQTQIQQLGRANRVADQTLKEQKNFLAMLSHEFRTPLGIMKANVDAVLTSPTARDPFIDESLERVQSASTRLSTLVEGCLNDEWMSNTIESGEGHYARVNLEEILTQLADEYSINHNRAEPLPTIAADRYLILILFSSLIDNGCRYASSPSAVKVSGAAHEEWVTVEIEDDGPGIAPEEQKQIFDKYSRAKNGNKKPGAGLGLYFVKRITELHGGTVTLKSNNSSTLFRITLPLNALGPAQ